MGRSNGAGSLERPRRLRVFRRRAREKAHGGSRRPPSGRRRMDGSRPVRCLRHGLRELHLAVLRKPWRARRARRRPAGDERRASRPLARRWYGTRPFPVTPGAPVTRGWGGSRGGIRSNAPARRDRVADVVQDGGIPEVRSGTFRGLRQSLGGARERNYGPSRRPRSRPSLEADRRTTHSPDRCRVGSRRWRLRVVHGMGASLAGLALRQLQMPQRSTRNRRGGGPPRLPGVRGPPLCSRDPSMV
jgi:hypothetical protein